MTCHAPTSSCAQPKVFRGLSSSSLPLSATRTISLLAILVPGNRSTAPPFGQKLKAQRSGNRCGFDQLDGHRIAKTICFARARTDHRMAFLVVAVIFLANGSRRHETVGSRVAQL